MECSASHDNSEFLRGFTNTSRFSFWARNSPSILWCKAVSQDASTPHQTAAACVLRHALSSEQHFIHSDASAKPPVEILYYRCGEMPSTSVRTEIIEELEDTRLSRGSQNMSSKTKIRMLQSELMLRAFIAQLIGDKSSQLIECAKLIDPSRTVPHNLKTIFKSLLSRRKARVFLIVDDIHCLTFNNTQLLSTLSDVSRDATDSAECSVLLGGATAPELLLTSLNPVDPTSEYQGR